MLSKTQIKYIQSLRQKKYRHLHGVYIVEGEKIVSEYILQDYPLINIYADSQWSIENHNITSKESPPLTIVNEQELRKISTLSSPNKVVALARLPAQLSENKMAALLGRGLHLGLEALRDPGNLGTVIRTADWFGFDSIICSEDCVDAYNPKVVQASMGSLARVRMIYTSIASILKSTKLPVYAACVEGENIFEETLPSDAIIVIGNESNGLSEGTMNLSSKKVRIPRFGKSESLNAAVAAGIIMVEFRRAPLPSP